MLNRSITTIVAGLCVVGLQAQEVEIGEVSIRQVTPCSLAECPEIRVVVDVTDKTGNAVVFPEPLKDHFSVCETLGGEPCPVQDFDVTRIDVDEAITVALVIDRSESMKNPGTKLETKMDEAKRAARILVDRPELGPQDRVALSSFGSDCAQDVPFTFMDDGGKNALKAGIDALSPSGATAFFGCVCEAIAALSNEPAGVKFVIALTDGVEGRAAGNFIVPQSTSCVTGCVFPVSTPAQLCDCDPPRYQPLCDQVTPTGVPVFTVGFGQPGDISDCELEGIAECTGGEFIEAPTATELAAFFEEILGRIRAQYLIEYCTPCSMGATDPVTLEICAGDRPVSCSSESSCDQATYTLRQPPRTMRTAETVALEEACQSENASLRICATFTSKEPISDARVFYRTTGTDAYEEGAMTDQGGDLWCFDIPATAAIPPGVDYFISVSDGRCPGTDPQSVPRENPYQIDVCPPCRPEVEHQPVQEYCPGEAIPIAARVFIPPGSDPKCAVASVEVFYRRAGLIRFEDTPLQREAADSDVWSGQIPANVVDEPGMDYYVKACTNTGICAFSGTPDSPIGIDAQAVDCGGPPFVRCDANDDGRTDVADAVWTVSALFRDNRGFACDQAADCDADGVLNLSDAIFNIDYEFRNGLAPSEPFPTCGSTASAPLSCDAYSHCK